MQNLTAAVAALTALLVLPVAVEAKTTRVFSGEAPWEVEKNAKKAGYDYPDGEMKCSP